MRLTETHNEIRLLNLISRSCRNFSYVPFGWKLFWQSSCDGYCSSLITSQITRATTQGLSQNSRNERKPRPARSPLSICSNNSTISTRTTDMQLSRHIQARLLPLCKHYGAFDLTEVRETQMVAYLSWRHHHISRNYDISRIEAHRRVLCAARPRIVN
jgi:hypothetical protein